MKFIDAIRRILASSADGKTPQQIRDTIKVEYPDLYGTESHHKNVEGGHYKDLDHALLAQIYTAVRQAPDIYVDRSTKPHTVSLVAGSDALDRGGEDDSDVIETEDLQRLEAGVGTVYVLGTSLFSEAGEEIVKIGITTGTIEDRIRQLYTTSVPTKFRVIATYDVSNYSELEQSLHRLLEPYRINRAREFFTEKCVPFLRRIASIHMEIQAGQGDADEAQQGTAGELGG